MMLIKLIGVGLCGVVTNLVLKQIKPEFCFVSNLCVGLTMFLLVAGGVKDIITNIIDIQKEANIKLDVIESILKVVGVGYMTEFASDLAEESGNKSISSKIILGGKVSICVAALPILKSLINAIISLI